MAEVKSEGKKKVDVLDGNVKMEQGNNYISFYDIINGVYCMIWGQFPDGTYGFLIAKQGEDVFDIFS